MQPNTVQYDTKETGTDFLESRQIKRIKDVPNKNI